MRLEKAPHGDLRITFQGDAQETFIRAWGICTRDQRGYPDDLHELRPYGVNVQERYIAVALCKNAEVLVRIKALMSRLERECGMTVDDAVREQMEAWRATERPRRRPEARGETEHKRLQAAFPECCAACEYRNMIKHGDCKLYLMMGEAACENKGG